MSTGQSERERNLAAFRRLEAVIKKRYPPGHYVAISGGRIVAAAPTFRELRTLTKLAGTQPESTLVVRAGEEYPMSATIFLPFHRP